MSPVLLDSGPIVALMDRSERYHKQCLKLFDSLEAPLVTCEAVIAEAMYLLRDLRGAAVDLITNIEHGNILIPYRLVGRTPEVTKLIKKYADVPMSFADACLVDMADGLNTGRILTFDGDFRVYRWGRNRPFDLIFSESRR